MVFDRRGSNPLGVVRNMGYWRNWKRASLARTRYWDRNPDTPKFAFVRMLYKHPCSCVCVCLSVRQIFFRLQIKNRWLDLDDHLKANISREADFFQQPVQIGPKAVWMGQKRNGKGAMVSPSETECKSNLQQSHRTHSNTNKL